MLLYCSQVLLVCPGGCVGVPFSCTIAHMLHMVGSCLLSFTNEKWCLSIVFFLLFPFLNCKIQFSPNSGTFSCVQKPGLGSLAVNTLNFFHNGTPIYTVIACLLLCRYAPTGHTDSRHQALSRFLIAQHLLILKYLVNKEGVRG